MGKLLKTFLIGLAYLVLPIVVFYVAYDGTELYFRLKKISYPFELFGIFVALGLASWTLALVEGLRALKRKFIGKNHKGVIS